MPKLPYILSSLSAAFLLNFTQNAGALEVPVLDDALIIQSSPTFNYGANTTLQVYGTANANRWAYVKFDVASVVPPGYGAADVTQALLRVFVSSVTTAGSVTLTSVTSTWTEGAANGTASAGTITWNLKPTDSGTALATIPITAGSLNGFVTIDVTSLVKSWISSPSANFGLVFKPIGTTAMYFDSKENINTSHGPLLDITLATRRVQPAGDVSMGTYVNGLQP